MKMHICAGRTRILRLTACTALAGAALGSAFAAGHSRRYVLDPGTVLPVRLDTSLSSKDSHAGDVFSTTVTDQDNAALPAGTKVEGVVRSAQPRHGKQPGTLDLAFDRLVLPGGRAYSLDGSLIALDNKSVKRAAGGRLVATSAHRTDRLTYVGYGAGAGLLVSVLTHRKSTLTDTLLGGGLGYLYGALQKGHGNARDVNLKSGTKLGVRLNTRLSFNR
ncbi:MAG TPA: hypothetical protein VKT32_09095 [Chthonomonadaceae bacterium]|nr:hypothetical protein [Chthonomonadaceae bacterium]